MSAISGQRLDSLTSKTIQSMRNNVDFDLFYQKFSKKAGTTHDLNEAVFPRKRSWPNYTILQSVRGHEEKTDAVEPYDPTTVK